MGAVCYQPKKKSVSKEDIIKAIKDKSIKETITEPDYKSLKTEEKTENHANTFNNFTNNINIETLEQQQIRTHKLNCNLNPNKGGFADIQMKILSYYGAKDDMYQVMLELNKQSLHYMRKNFSKIDTTQKLKHSNEKIRFQLVKTIEEHQSGINQMLKLPSNALVTVSDDCSLKFWSVSHFSVEHSILTETITCIAATGPKKEILVSGCHSGNLIIFSVSSKGKKEILNMAHQNLIRVVVTLEALKSKYFVTADVCGIIKVWSSSMKPQLMLEIKQDGAISYNSVIEVLDILPKRNQFEDSTIIACAMKQQKINLILLVPEANSYQIIKTLNSNLKPTCLIQLNSKHLALAVGSLKEESNIEIHDINRNKIVSTLKKHKDMIDSMLKLEFNSEKTKSFNPYVNWLISASRDRTIVLWKLFEGKPMKREIVHIQSTLISQPSLVMSKRQHKKSIEIDQKNESNNPLEEEKEPQTISQIQQYSEQVSGRQRQQDYYYCLETNHKDFIRSMVQLNSSTLLTASEDKTIKHFTITF